MAGRNAEKRSRNCISWEHRIVVSVTVCVGTMCGNVAACSRSTGKEQKIAPRRKRNVSVGTFRWTRKFH